MIGGGWHRGTWREAMERVGSVTVVRAARRFTILPGPRCGPLHPRARA